MKVKSLLYSSLDNNDSLSQSKRLSTEYDTFTINNNCIALYLNPTVKYIPLLNVNRSKLTAVLKSLNKTQNIATLNFNNLEANEFIKSVISVTKIPDKYRTGSTKEIVTQIFNSNNEYLINSFTRKLKDLFISEISASLLDLKRSIVYHDINDCVCRIKYFNILERHTPKKAVSKSYFTDYYGVITSKYKEEPINYFSVPYGMFTIKNNQLENLQYILCIDKNVISQLYHLDGYIESKYYKLFVREDLISSNNANPHLKNYFEKVVVPFCKEQEIDILAVNSLQKFYSRPIEKPKSLGDSNILKEQAVKRFKECLSNIAI
jgi:hypothetical protein